LKIREMNSGLQFPEGPIAMADGSVILVEIARATLSRVTPDGRVHVVADLGGGPNGAAIGPDGAAWSFDITAPERVHKEPWPSPQRAAFTKEDGEAARRRGGSTCRDLTGACPRSTPQCPTRPPSHGSPALAVVQVGQRAARARARSDAPQDTTW
jgi:sugar lactone lactonase YvrE